MAFTEIDGENSGIYSAAVRTDAARYGRPQRRPEFRFRVTGDEVELFGISYSIEETQKSDEKLAVYPEKTDDPLLLQDDQVFIPGSALPEDYEPSDTATEFQGEEFYRVDSSQDVAALQKILEGEPVTWLGDINWR